jgi:hypothetical protein
VSESRPEGRRGARDVGPIRGDAVRADQAKLKPEVGGNDVDDRRAFSRSPRDATMSRCSRASRVSLARERAGARITDPLVRLVQHGGNLPRLAAQSDLS